jgi:long-chain fatty acid transport protein
MEPKRATGMAVALLLSATAGYAQTPTPSAPPRLEQDQLDLQARANVVEGSGARALGMGGAFLARADDATAASWNPAGLSYLRLPEVSAVWARANFDSDEILPTGDLNKVDHLRGSTPDFFAVTYPVGFKGITGSAQLSFQRVISFRYDRTIDEFSPLSAHSGGGFDVLAFGGGFQVARWLRAGLTINRWFNGYTQHSVRTINNIAQPGSRTFDTDFRLAAWNGNLGTIWTPSEKVNIGAVVKTPFSGEVKLARERIDIVNTATGDRLEANDHSRDDLTLDFPGAVGVGASFRPWSALTASVDYTRTFWSNGRIYNFFTLPKRGVPEETVPPEGPDFFSVLPYPTLVDPEQKDTEQVRAGLEYVVIRGRWKLPVRVGYYNDRQYFRSLPGSAPRFNAWTAGAGIILGRVLFDGAYAYERGRYVDLQANSVHVNSHRIYASFIYRHNPH